MYIAFHSQILPTLLLATVGTLAQPLPAILPSPSEIPNPVRDSVHDDPPGVAGAAKNGGTVASQDAVAEQPDSTPVSPPVITSPAAARETGRDPAVSAGDKSRPVLPLVAVMPLTAIGIDSTAAQIATGALAAELFNTRHIRLLERDQMNQILVEQGFQQSGACAESECAVEMGRILGADRVLIGSVARIGPSTYLSTRLVLVETGEVIASVHRSLKGDFDDILPVLVAEVSRGILDGFPDGAALASGVTGRTNQKQLARREVPTHGVIFGIEVVDYDIQGRLNHAHWRMSEEIKELCCLDVAWHRWKAGGGLLSFGPSINVGGWALTGLNPDGFGIELLLAGSAQVNIAHSLGRQVFLRADAGITQLTVARYETGTDWGYGFASTLGYWIPYGGRSYLVAIGTGWRTYMHLDYENVAMVNLSLGLLL